MKSPPALTAATDDGDDIFGPPRTYATGYCPPKHRPSMISAKYRQKEERRKVLKISVNKLKKIEDPEASLCRSVLINNTVRRLQRDARDEKSHKHYHNHQHNHHNTTTTTTQQSVVSEIEECDVQEVLSQFYMPPTPRMLTSIDDDEDVNVVDEVEVEEEEPAAKRPKICTNNNNTTECVTTTTTRCYDTTTTAANEQTANTTFTCGSQAMFSEMQTNGFYSLIASLET